MGGKNSDPTRSPGALLTAAFYAPKTDTVFVLHMNRRDHAIFRAALGEILSIVIGEARVTRRERARAPFNSIQFRNLISGYGFGNLYKRLVVNSSELF